MKSLEPMDKNATKLMLKDLLEQIEKCNWNYLLPEFWESTNEHALYMEILERALNQTIKELGSK